MEADLRCSSVVGCPTVVAAGLDRCIDACLMGGWSQIGCSPAIATGLDRLIEDGGYGVICCWTEARWWSRLDVWERLSGSLAQFKPEAKSRSTAGWMTLQNGGCTADRPPVGRNTMAFQPRLNGSYGNTRGGFRAGNMLLFFSDVG